MNDYQNNNSNYNNTSTRNRGVDGFYDFSNDNDSYYASNTGYTAPVLEIQTTNQQKVVSRAYLIMFAVLIVSGLTALISSTVIEDVILNNPGLLFGAIIAQVVVVIVANVALGNKKETLSALMLLVYSVVNGFTLSVIFLTYEIGSIFSIFFVAAAMFGVLGFIGATTKKDFSALGSVGIMLLVGIILASIVNIFIGSSTLDFGITVLGLAVFIGLTLYDFQKIKRLGAYCSDDEVNSLAMFGALQLYLDFVNLFLRLLRLFADRRN